MTKSRFRLNQFDLEHHRSTMKIGTDALLLGAWSPVSGDINSVLDIGSGCGIISMMLAQRLPQAKIHGIDKHLPSIQEAEDNANRSKWCHRLQFFHHDVIDFFRATPYDLIISNPPYFRGQIPKQADNLAARHQMSLTTVEMFAAVSRLLSKEGCFATILPASQENSMITVAQTYGMYPLLKTSVRHHEAATSKRTLMALSRAATSCIETILMIGIDGHRTPAYDRLLEPFISDHQKRPPLG